MSWTKTRYCYCGECRFHSTQEPGWETCPNPGKKKQGTWLWVKSMSSSLDLEGQDKAYLKQQSRQVEYEDD